MQTSWLVLGKRPQIVKSQTNCVFKKNANLLAGTRQNTKNREILNTCRFKKMQISWLVLGNTPKSRNPKLIAFQKMQTSWLVLDKTPKIEKS